MVKRHARAAFGSKFAFPGGVLEEADQHVCSLCDGRSAQAANSLLGVSRGGLEYYSAAIRETFEETGVLLAEHKLNERDLAAARDAINAGTLAWDRFAFENGLRLQSDRLHYFSYWITPVDQPKRFSTRFFLAEVPAGQTARHDGAELTESRWMSAADVLEASRNKHLQLPYVTEKTLLRLASFSDTRDLVGWAKACEDRGVLRDRPAFPPEEFA